MEMSSAGAIGLTMAVGAIVGGGAAFAAGHTESMGDSAKLAVPAGALGGVLFQGLGELIALKPGSSELSFWGGKTEPIVRHAAVGAVLGALAGAAASRLVSGDMETMSVT